MNNRAFGMVALIAVVAVSVVFGMVLGARLTPPRVIHADTSPASFARSAPLQLAPAQTKAAGATSFADIVETSLPAVVGVTNTQLVDEEQASEDERNEPFFRWFFGRPEEQENGPRRDNRRQGSGSGFVVSPDGYILTNDHVVADSSRIQVSLQDGRTVDATLVGADPAIDLALIKIDAGDKALPVLPLGNSKELRVGEWVIAIGNPLDFEQTVTVGVVSAKERQVPIGETDLGLAQFIQTDAAINFGNSGGPLLDAAGNVIGINTAIRRGNMAEGIGFALPIDQARSAMEQLLSTGEVQRGFLGISLGNDIDRRAAEFYGLPDERGALVEQVTPDQPADRAGLRRGDVIRKVDGSIVRNNRDLIRKISARFPGDEVELEVVRDGRTIEKTALLMDRKESTRGRRGNPFESRPEPEPEEEPAESTGLGVTVENLTRTMRERLGVGDGVRGVLVVSVEYDSPSADADIVPNTLITAINDQPIEDVDAWNDVIGSLEPGAVIRVDCYEGGVFRYRYVRVPEE